MDWQHEEYGRQSAFRGDNKVVAAAIVLCMLDVRTGETIASGEWENGGVIPLIERAAVLSPKVGNNVTRVLRAEMTAFCLGAEALDPAMPKVAIIDVSGVRSTVMSLRDNSANSERDRLRHTYSGLERRL